MKKVTKRVKCKAKFGMVLEESPVTKFGSHDERLLPMVVPVAVSGEEGSLEDFRLQEKFQKSTSFMYDSNLMSILLFAIYKYNRRRK